MKNFLQAPLQTLTAAMGRSAIFILTVTICITISAVKSVSFEEDTRLTALEAEKLAQYKNQVLPSLSHKYMEQNIFLVRWLRARNFEVDRAKEMLLKYIKWRKENNVDRIDLENWKEFEIDYPYLIGGADKDGRPMVQVVLRDWDIRKAVVAGKREQLLRWTYKYFDDATALVRQLQDEGKNVTQFKLLIDAEGFNPITHGCPLCMPYYLALANIYEEYYPGSVDKIHVVNTPDFFRVVLRLVWPLLSENTKQSLKIHGTDINTWKKALFREIDSSQLLQTFGGSIDL